MPPKCQDCIWWNGVPDSGEFGECALITDNKTNTKAAIDADFYRRNVEFWTKPDFGCVLYNAKS